jgi:hypothetical protein
MDTLLELAIGVLGFAGGIVLFRLFKPKSIAKENQIVIAKVEDKEKENEKLANEILKSMESAAKKVAELEKEKNKEVTEKETEDFFNNRTKH